MRFSVGILSSLAASFLFVVSFAAQGELADTATINVSAEILFSKDESKCSIKADNYNLDLGTYTYYKYSNKLTKNDPELTSDIQVTAKCTSVPKHFSKGQIRISRKNDNNQVKFEFVSENELKGKLGHKKDKENTIPYSLFFPNVKRTNKGNFLIGTITNKLRSKTIPIEGKLDLEEINKEKEKYQDIKEGTYRGTIEIELYL
jgi:hypothetical protein